MADMPSEDATVLVVEDKDRVADLFVSVLSTEYIVMRAEDGPEALELFDESVDVVLLDRRLPEMTGDEILEQIRSRDASCRVAMVSGGDPEMEVIENGFNDYLVKPVDNETLVKTVERLLALNKYEVIYQELSAKQVKKNVLKLEKTATELEESDEFQQLTAEIKELKATLGEMEAEQEFVENQLPN